MRVTEWRFEPGAETGWHRHEADYVVVPLADGDLLLEQPGGSSRTATLKRHVPYARREGVEHNVINANALRLRLHRDRASEAVEARRARPYSSTYFPNDFILPRGLEPIILLVRLAASYEFTK